VLYLEQNNDGLTAAFFSVDHINESFISFLIDNIENPVSDGEAGEIPDTFLKLILAFNLHFEMPEDNLIMKVLATRGTAKSFTEMLMLRVNRQGMYKIREKVIKLCHNVDLKI
jgi:hypothetical protein